MEQRAHADGAPAKRALITPRRAIVAGILAATMSVAAVGYVHAQGYGGWGMRGYGPGMMGGPGSGHGPGMMGGRGPGMMGGCGPGRNFAMMRGPGRGFGPGMGQGNGPGPRGFAGPGPQQDLKLTTAEVKANLERWIAFQHNPHIKVGDIKEKDANTIQADIVTKDNSLVQRFVVNRHTGFYWPSEQ